MKKTIAVILAALMVLTVMPMTVFAEESSISEIVFTAKEDKVVYEYTNGYKAYDERGEWFYYYMPDFAVGDQLTIIYDDTTSETYYYQKNNSDYTGHFVSSNGEKTLDDYDVRTQYDSEFEQSYDNQYTYGEYTYYVALNDPEVSGNEGYFKTSCEFTFAPNPVTSIEVDFAPIVLTENKDGQYMYDGNYERYFNYRFNYFVEGNKIILHTADEDIVYTCAQTTNSYGQTILDFVDKNGNLYPVESFVYDDGQQTNHWTGGNTYKVKYTYLDHFETTFDVRVDEAPTAISVAGYKEGSALKNTGGYTTTDSYGRSYYRYVTPSLCYGDTVLTVTYPTQGERVYHVESRYNEEFEYTYYVFVDKDGNELTEYVGVVDDQDENHWDVGEHTYHFELYGLSTQDFTFTVEEAPIDFELDGYSGGSALENDNGYYEYDDHGEMYYKYYLPGVCSEGVTLTLKYSNAPDKVYTATQFYDEDGEYYYWEFLDENGNAPNGCPYVNDPQGSEHWGVGEHTYTVRLGDISKQYTFTVEEAPSDFEIEGFDGDVSVMENTNGMVSIGDDDEEYFEYWLPGIIEEGRSLTLKYSSGKEVVYNAVLKHDDEYDNDYFEFEDADGNTINVYAYSDQDENHWGVGEHTYYVNCEGVVKEYTFTVTPGAERVEFEFAPQYKTTFFENTDGYYDDVSKTFIYNVPNPVEEGNVITFYYPEESGLEPTVFTCQRVTNPNNPDDNYFAFVDEDGNELEEWIHYTYEQFESPFELGENHVAISIGNFEAEVVFTVLGGPTGIEFQLNGSVVIYEETSGHYETDASGESFFRYDYYDEVLFREGNVITLQFSDGRDNIDYEAVLIEREGWSEIRYVNVNDESDVLDIFTAVIKDTQFDYHWGVGTHTANIVYADCSCAFDVTIAQSNVASIVFSYAGDTPALAEGEDMIERFPDAESQPVMVYDLGKAILQDGNTLTVNYIDETSEVYTVRYDEELDFYGFIDENGKVLDAKYASIIDDQIESPWEKGLHSFSICYMGAYAEAEVYIGEPEPEIPWVMGVEVYDQNGNTYSDGDTITLSPDDSIFIYFITDPRNEEHGISPFVGFSDGFSEGTLTTAGFTVVTGEATDFGYEVEHEGAFGLKITAKDLIGGTNGTLGYYLYELPKDWSWADFNNFDFAGTPRAAEYSLDFLVVKEGWNYVGGNWYYVKNNAPLTGWASIKGVWYYFDADGVMQTGITNVKGKDYYLAANGAMQTGWIKETYEDGYYNWYYADSNGVLLRGWQKIGNVWYYLMPNEYFMIFGTDAEINGATYRFAKSGAMVTGWQQISAGWNYFTASGAMVKNAWQLINKVWYHFDESGLMQKGWVQIGSSWYYMSGSGAMQTGWVKVGNYWYYFNSSGVMQTGWLRVSGKWYYLESSGRMRTANLTYKGKVYRFNSSGACLNP